MNEQFKPIGEEVKTPNAGFTTINEEQKVPPVNPTNTNNNDEVLKNLPEWSLEPPVEIKR